MTKLARLLDVLLPGDERFPPGSTTQVASWLAERPEQFRAALEAVLTVLPDVLTETDAAAAEAAQPRAFATLLTGIYTAYYTDPVVRAVIERATGYSAGPPQPHGYVLPPFDPTFVALPAASAPSWRKV